MAQTSCDVLVVLCNQCLAAEVHYTGPEGARAKATKVVKLNIALFPTGYIIVYLKVLKIKTKLESIEVEYQQLSGT